MEKAKANIFRGVFTKLINLTAFVCIACFIANIAIPVRNSVNPYEQGKSNTSRLDSPIILLSATIAEVQNPDSPVLDESETKIEAESQRTEKTHSISENVSNQKSDDSEINNESKIESSTENSTESINENSTDSNNENSTDNNIESNNENSTESINENSTDSNNENSTDNNIESNNENSTESINENSTDNNIDSSNTEINIKQLDQSEEWESIEMRVTAYCPCPQCCGEYSDGITACGHEIQPGDTFVAADGRFPFGTEMLIPGYNNSQPVKVLDKGGAIKGNRLDVFFATHEEAQEWGVQYLEVKINHK